MAVKVHPLQPNWANIYLRRLLLVIQGKTLVQTIMTAKVRPEYPQEDLSSAWLRLMQHLCSNSVPTPLTWGTIPWSPPPSLHHLSENLHPRPHPPNSFWNPNNWGFHIRRNLLSIYLVMIYWCESSNFCPKIIWDSVLKSVEDFIFWLGNLNCGKALICKSRTIATELFKCFWSICREMWRVAKVFWKFAWTTPVAWRTKEYEF